MPRNVIFVAPYPSEVTMRFVRAAASLEDVRLLGLVHTPPPNHGEVYADIVRVTEPYSVADLVEGIEVLKRRHGEPFRVIGILEAMMVQLAQAREAHKVPGTPSKTAELFREKAMMKDALRAAGLPVGGAGGDAVLSGGGFQAREEALRNDDGMRLALPPMLQRQGQ